MTLARAHCVLVRNGTGAPPNWVITVFSSPLPGASIAANATDPADTDTTMGAVRSARKTGRPRSFTVRGITTSRPNTMRPTTTPTQKTAVVSIVRPNAGSVNVRT
ncbi:hypothetical protein WDV91_08585 [Curtobacterium flaccumfaciens pv. flaccumfaciens]